MDCSVGGCVFVCMSVRVGGNRGCTAFQLIHLYLFIHLCSAPVMDRSFYESVCVCLVMCVCLVRTCEIQDDIQ